MMLTALPVAGLDFFFRQFERVSHQLRAVADEHLHQLWPRQLQEHRIRVLRTSTRQQGFPRPWRAVKEHACRKNKDEAHKIHAEMHRLNRRKGKFLP